MAKGFGGPSKFIAKHVKFNGAIYLSLAVSIMVGMYFIYLLVYKIFTKNHIGVSVIFLILYVIFALLLNKILNFAFNVDTYYMSGEGEGEVRDELDKFSDEYSFFRGVKISGTP